MFKDIPIQFWILILIMLAGYQPARFLYQHLTQSRDVIPDKANNNNFGFSALALNLMSLVALACLAAFIFTPAAAQFARSPSFAPLLMAAVAILNLYWAANGLAKGTIRPFLRGFDDSYSRDGQPVRFWLSIGWSAAIAAFLLWITHIGLAQASIDALESQCFDGQDVQSTPEREAACRQLIGEYDENPDDTGYAMGARGRAYHRLGIYPEAMADYTEAIRIDPSEPSYFFNRGLVHQQLGNDDHAFRDFSTAVQLHPDYTNAYFERGLILLGKREFDRAIEDFTRAHALNPKDAWPLANRGLSYALKNQTDLAERDFAAVRAIDPTNIVLLHGMAVLTRNTGNAEATLDSLTSILNRYPTDKWSLRRRAELYRELGKIEKSDADLAMLQLLLEAEN